ncbi:carboxypeptidase-like regulatory domain-containing protein [Maricaulaceae bacterium MS644]
MGDAMIRGLAIAAALVLCACSQTVITAQGYVYDLAGAPVEGAVIEVGDGAASGGAVSGPDGHFTIKAVRPSRSVPLPASSVLPEPLELSAHSSVGAGLSQATVLSVGETAGTRADFILLPFADIAAAQALLTRRARACGAVEGRAYAHAMLDRLDQIRASPAVQSVIATRGIEGLPLRLEALVMNARHDCALPEENWRGDIAALEATFGDYR